MGTGADPESRWESSAVRRRSPCATKERSDPRGRSSTTRERIYSSPGEGKKCIYLRVCRLQKFAITPEKRIFSFSFSSWSTLTLFEQWTQTISFIVLCQSSNSLTKMPSFPSPKKGISINRNDFLFGLSPFTKVPEQIRPSERCEISTTLPAALFDKPVRVASAFCVNWPPLYTLRSLICSLYPRRESSISFHRPLFINPFEKKLRPRSLNKKKTEKNPYKENIQKWSYY